jgi:hypothetical protein
MKEIATSSKPPSSSCYEDIVAGCSWAFAWHELTHASQLQRMKREKGSSWASDYWSHVVLQEVKNDKNTGSPYGSKGDDNWQVIALAEGWAYYREWELSRTKLAWNSLNETAWTANSTLPTTGSYSTLRFPKTYVPMFYELVVAGCSFTNIEKSLCTYSITGFRDNLIAKHSNLRARITEIISAYE